jgi:phospholipid/cholesterol/gamma-HCH transport system ATP-binding protein
MVSGRIGSAISAELGSMVVSQQIDAMRALGSDPLKKLVTPRLLALIIMLPLLTVAADLFGIIGGGTVASYIFDQDVNVFLTSVRNGITTEDVLGGIIKPVFFGMLIGGIACHKGLSTTGGTGRRRALDDQRRSSVVDLGHYFRLLPRKGDSICSWSRRHLAAILSQLMFSSADIDILDDLEEHLEPTDLEDAVDRPDRTLSAIEFRDVHLAFDDKKVLDGVSFTVRRGETKLILGRSGGGKSTTIRLILGLLKPDSGRILIDGEDITDYTEEEMMGVRKKIGMVFQEGALFDSLSVYENVAYRLREQGVIDEEEVELEVRRMLRFVELEEAIDKMPDELSGGMRRRVGIARALVGDPEIVLFDEPTAGTRSTDCSHDLPARDQASGSSGCVLDLRDA